MRSRPRHTTALSAGLVLLASAAGAQAPNIQVQGRIQVQYRSSSGDSTGSYNPTLVNNVFEIRRLQIQTNVRFGDDISLLIQPSFEMGSLRMRSAFLRVSLTPALAIVAGQDKSPFQRYELTSANNLLSIERGVRVLRLSGKEGLNDLLIQNGYAAHDLGAFFEAETKDRRVFVKAGIQAGSRESTTDVNNAKSFFARATGTALLNQDHQPLLQLGASFGSRDRAICSGACAGTYFADSSKRTTAFGLDAEWGGFRPGVHVIADFATGDNVPIARRINTGRNTGNLRNSADSNVVTFMSVSVIAAYRIVTKGPDTRVIKMVEPAIRCDYTDPATGAANDHGILVSPVLNLYFANSVQLRAGVDLYSYQDATGVSQSARELKFSWQANF